MEDDQTREEDPVGDDREAFKREQELQFSLNAIRQKALIRTRPTGSEELERWDPDADETSGELNDGTAGDPQDRAPVGRAGRDPRVLVSPSMLRSGSRAGKKPIFGKEELDEVIALAIPALGSLLADPLMSLVDTAVVGRHSSTSLAALGPSTAVFQIVFQLFSFLSITTTGMVARACAGGDNGTVRRALANSTILAVAFGTVTCLGLNAFAPAVLSAMGCGTDLVAAATPYLRVRAFAIPAVLFCTSAQGGCLGLQDARTPLLIFTLAAVVNVAGDLYAVGGAGGLGGLGFGLGLGVKGAAWATLAAQYVSAAVFFRVLTSRRMLPLTWGDWRLPSGAEMRQMCSISGMLLLGSLCRMGVYTMMTMTALKIGALTMAAHQVALQIFWTLTYFVDPLFVAATSFIARDHGRRPERVRRMAWLLLRLSVGVGAFIAVVCYLIPTFAAGTFTTDPTLATMIGSIAPLMGTAQLVSAVVLVAEGVLIGCGDLRYLLKVHCVNFFALGALLWWVRHSGLGLHGIWIAVLANQLLRLSQHAAHVWRGGGPDLLDRATKAAVGNGGG